MPKDDHVYKVARWLCDQYATEYKLFPDAHWSDNSNYYKEQAAKLINSLPPLKKTAMTDEQILAIMHEGYGCRENDWADHIAFARAIIEKNENNQNILRKL